MASAKSKTGLNPGPIQSHDGRRSFIKKASAAVSAVFASTVAGFTRSRTNQDTDLRGQVERLSRQLKCLEDANAIRRLYQTYESYLDQGKYEQIVDLFARKSEVIFHGGLFAGRDSGVRRLYCGHFRHGQTGKKIETPPGFEPDPEQLQDTVEVAPDRRSARARFPYSLQVGTPLVGDSSLLQMARLQGQGIKYWWEGGIQEISWVKEEEDWKIKRLEYQVMAGADYRPGQSHAGPMPVPVFARVYPDDPTGPDILVLRRESQA